MGAWDTGVFDNDTAADFSGNLEQWQADARKIFAALLA